MEKAPEPEANDPREQELKADVLRNMLSREQIYDLDVEAELAKLQREDPLTDEIIRHFVERYFPGRVNMAQKEKAARILLAAFHIRGRIDDTFEGLNITDVLKEIDDMTAPPLEEPPENVQT
jgi:hypothetical protein